MLRIFTLVQLIVVVFLTAQLLTVLAASFNKQPHQRLMEAGYAVYIEDGIAYAVVPPSPLYIEEVAGIIGYDTRLGYSTCYRPVGYITPPNLLLTTSSGKPLMLQASELWASGMGVVESMNILYNGTHAVFTLKLSKPDLMAAYNILSKSGPDLCVRVLMG
jgi:hypothetical protein